jgi:DNA-binding transcriptional ArsR family regulator
MNLSPTKYEILKTMLLRDKSTKATDIAKEVKKEFPSVMMHIIGLTRMGYTKSPEKGLYVITEKGKRALGLGEVDPEKAKTILEHMSPDKAFHFYARIGKPLDLHAHGLRDLRDKILRADVESIEFHMHRGDFEAWFAGLGDVELAKKAALLKEKKMTGEELRSRLHELVENRFIVLTRVVDNTVSP